MDLLFALINLAVLPFWLLMIALPRWRITAVVMGSPWALLPLPAVYAALLVPAMPDLLPLLLSPTLDDIARLLGSREGALVGWVHFLAFDLFVGRWAYLDSRERELSPLVMAPVLMLVFLFGPLGLLTYLVVRSLKGRNPAVA
jgi:hypothetical protein